MRNFVPCQRTSLTIVAAATQITRVMGLVEFTAEVLVYPVSLIT
jgi:hypothetical protein